MQHAATHEPGIGKGEFAAMRRVRLLTEIRHLGCVLLTPCGARQRSQPRSEGPAVDPTPPFSEVAVPAMHHLSPKACYPGSSFEVGRALGMRLREFIGATSAVVAWPLAIRAQSAERVQRIGVLRHLEADDGEGFGIS